MEERGGYLDFSRLTPGELIGMAKAAPELLQEDRGAFGRAEKQYRVDARDIETLIEEVAYEQHGDLA